MSLEIKGHTVKTKGIVAVLPATQGQEMGTKLRYLDGSTIFIQGISPGDVQEKIDLARTLDSDNK